jgi:uncharacterized membrane protein YbhN (UPF0104 family)
MTGRAGSRRVWAFARALGGAAIVAGVVWRLGTGPFLDGLRAVDVPAVAAALGLGFVTTTAAAWRWRLVARGLDVALPLRTATAAYYRSQLLNSVLPGGVVGDVDRALRHGHEVGSVSRGLRAVGWERSAGQVVQVALGLVVLLLVPSPVPATVLLVVTAVVVLAGAGALLLAGLPPRGPTRWARLLRVVAADLRHGLLARRAWPGVALASAVVVTGHLATLVVAARTAGVGVPLARLLPLAVLVLLASAVPANVGGWGPREGVAAWAFTVAGLGAGQGVATTTVYAVLSLAALSPGAALLVAGWVRRNRATARRLGGGLRTAGAELVPVRARPAGGGHG